MVFVFRDDCAGRDLLSKEQKMLRATGFRSDLKEKFTGWRGNSLAQKPRMAGLDGRGGSRWGCRGLFRVLPAARELGTPGRCL